MIVINLWGSLLLAIYLNSKGTPWYMVTLVTMSAYVVIGKLAIFLEDEGE